MDEDLSDTLRIKFSPISKEWKHESKLLEMSKQDCYAQEFVSNEADNEYYILGTLSGSNEKPGVAVYLTNQLEIINSLLVPMKIGYRLGKTQTSPEEERREKILSPGERFIFNKFHPSRKILFDFKIRGFQRVQNLSIDNFIGSNALQKIAFQDFNGNKLHARVKYSGTLKRPSFAIYCDYFLMDHSDFIITIARRTDSKDSRLSLLPGFSRSEGPEDLQLPDVKAYPIDDSFRKDLLLFKDKYTDYPSEIIPVGLLGSSITRIQVPELNKFSNSFVLDLVIETKKLKLGKFSYDK